MKKAIQNFKNSKQLQERYFSYYPAKHIKFEGHTYAFKDSKSLKEKCVHLYYCKAEQHYIRISTVDKKPYLIETFYSIKEESLNNVRRVV